MELLTTKIIALTLLGALSLFFGLLPLRLRKTLARGNRVKRERVVSCLLCFGAGVLLATVFTHMLPETREGFQAAAESGVLGEGAASYPLAEVVTCAGFFLIYFVEEFVHKIFFHHQTRSGKKSKLVAAIEEESNQTTTNNNHNHVNHNHNNHNGINHNDKREEDRVPVYSISSRGGDEGGIDNPVFAGDLDAAAWNPSLRDSIISATQTPTTSRPHGNSVSPALPPLPLTDSKDVGDVVKDGEGGDHHGHSHMTLGKLGSKGIAANLRSLLVVLALSFHSVFEGLAVGLQEKEVDVWYLLGAISAHKFVIAFCMGLELLAGGTAASIMVIYMVVFALVSPIGVAFGILVTENLTGDAGMGGHLASVTVLQGLAGGTILYVTFFEVLERERSRAGGRLLRFFFVLFGFAAMASLEAVGGHSHGGHGHSHGGGHGHSHGGHEEHMHEEQLLNSTTTTFAPTTTGHGHSHGGHGHSHGGHGHSHSHGSEHVH